MILVSAWLIFAFGKFLYDVDRGTLFSDILNPCTNLLIAGILDMFFQTTSSLLFGGVMLTISLIMYAKQLLGG